MSKIERLTKEQQEALPAIRDEWLRIGLATGPGDRDAAEDAVRRAYAVAGLEPPGLVLWLRSPLEGAVGAAMLASGGMAQVRGQVRGQVRDRVWGQVGGQVRGRVEDQVSGQVWDQVSGQVWGQVWGQVEDQVRDQVGAQVHRSGYGSHDAGWLSFYDALRGSVPACERLVPLMDLALHAGWWWPFAGAVILTPRPDVLRRDDRGRLHCEDGPAILYPDEWGVWAWHGTRIPREWIEQREDIDPALAITHPNVEQRRAAAEIIGWARVLEQLQPVVVDADPDPQIGTLLRVDLPDAPGECFLRVLCGTGRTFALPVPPDMRTARQANAWTYGLDPEELTPEVRT